MTWFKVDDKAHANTKIRNVLATCPAALSLWTVAGSWVADELNDGFVPDSQLPWLMPAGAEELAQALVAARLWRRVRGGYRFHEWHKDGDGTKRNPTREEVLAERRKRAEAGQKGGLASGKTRSKKQAGAKANAEARASSIVEPPSRPSPSKEGSGGARPLPQGAARSPKPPDRPPTEVVEADNPDWRNGKAFGTEPDPADADRARNGAALAGAAIRRPSGLAARLSAIERARQPGSSLDALADAADGLPPLTQPPADESEDDPPLADVVQLHPAAEAGTRYQGGQA